MTLTLLLRLCQYRSGDATAKCETRSIGQPKIQESKAKERREVVQLEGLLLNN
jgi:hypothetical protein